MCKCVCVDGWRLITKLHSLGVKRAKFFLLKDMKPISWILVQRLREISKGS